MNRKLIAFTLVAFIAALIALVPSTAHAAIGRTGSNITVGRTQTINDDLYVAGSTITIDGRVNGNLIAAGGTIVLNGTITGSVLQMGGTSTINGTVMGSVMALGGTVTIDGRVRHDVTFVGGTLTVTSSAVVGRDVTAYAGSLVVDGHVTRNVRTGNGSVRVDSGAVIGGSLTYGGNARPRITSGATVRGPITHGAVSFPQGTLQAPWATGLSVILWLRTLIGLLVFGLLVILLFPALGRRGVQQLREHPLSSFGWGALTLVATPIAALVVLVVGLFLGGWWIALMCGALYWMALTVGVILAALFVGEIVSGLVSQQEQAQWISLIVGVVLLLVVSVVPVLGGLVMALAAVWGLGALMCVLVRALPVGRDTRAAPVTSAERLMPRAG